MSADNRGKDKVLMNDLSGGSVGGSNAATQGDHFKIRGLRPKQFLRMWRNKTGIQNLTLEQVWDHQHRSSACSMALLSDSTISVDQFTQLTREADAKSYEILCNGGTFDNWPYPIKERKKKKFPSNYTLN